MSRPTRPEVSDGALRAALDRVGPHIENYNATLDAISKDIKAVEQYLLSSGVRLNAYVEIGRNKGFPEGEGWDGSDNYSGPIYCDVENIEWAPSDDSGERWRIMYAKFRWHGEMEIYERIVFHESTFNGPNETLEWKPLIETPVAIRLQGHKHLAELVTNVGKLVEVRPFIETTDIPF
jgi:hypothetical protein